MKTGLRIKPRALKGILLFYIIFAACFGFPFRSERFPLELNDAILVILTYGIIGLGLFLAYGAHKEKLIYLLSLPLTGLGLICRYLLEYGEVSNTYNFTTINIVSYLIVVPILTVVAYRFLPRFIRKK